MADIKAGNRSPVTLTKKSLDTSEGQALLELLERTMSDGRLTDKEVKLLESWLKQNAANSTLPGIHFLREEVAGVLADGSVSDGERNLLQKAILRVLPATERERAKAKIADANAAETAARIAEASKATIKQRDYIRDLGGICPEDATKQKASEIIEHLLADRPTVRQQMILRFWNRTDLLSAGVEGVSNWMDQWYKDDPDRIAAWELWKKDVGDNGSRSPNEVPTVPVGVGHDYLQKVKKRAQGTLSLPALNLKPGITKKVLIILLGVVLLSPVIVPPLAGRQITIAGWIISAFGGYIIYRQVRKR